MNDEQLSPSEILEDAETVLADLNEKDPSDPVTKTLVQLFKLAKSQEKDYREMERLYLEENKLVEELNEEFKKREVQWEKQREEEADKERYREPKIYDIVAKYKSVVEDPAASMTYAAAVLLQGALENAAHTSTEVDQGICGGTATKAFALLSKGSKLITDAMVALAPAIDFYHSDEWKERNRG